MMTIYCRLWNQRGGKWEQGVVEGQEESFLFYYFIRIELVTYREPEYCVLLCTAHDQRHINKPHETLKH